MRTLVDSILGENNPRFDAFAAQYRAGVFSFFPGVDPKSDLMPSYEKFLAAVRSLPPQTRYHHLLTGLESMLTEQLEYVFQLLGIGAYREAVVRVKKEISEPLAVRRELVKRFEIDENFYKTVKRADRVVRMVRG